ncbi:hypothetical protein MK805_06020 [Shimazuella sp. AN120528]|uniref:hypothetical protein n=1 Tax=Shimazuella soli TaxID=1892854 RepID=UPI001F0DE9D0|nr:hypothetical protein [Shimazuella soli]MCH5584525.1 hypothetical protein [Shimazuella soli]
MTLQKVIQDYIDFLHKPITNSQDLKQDQTAFQEPEIKQLLRYAVDNRDSLDEILTSIAMVMPLDLDMYKKGLTCLICGSLIEFGGNPKIVVDHIIQQLENHLTATESFLSLAEQEEWEGGTLSPKELDFFFSYDSDALKASITSSYVVLATMTSVCRLKEARQSIRTNTPLIHQVIQLEDEVDNLYYLKQVLYSVDDYEMIILHPQSETGLKIKADMIQNNFHFFTLLQDLYLTQFATHPAFATFHRNEKAIHLAKGGALSDTEEQIHDHALFGFYDFHALNGEGKIPSAVMPANWLFGEGTLHHIPKLNGVPVVILGENTLGDRSWDITFCTPVHEALKPSLEAVEVLSSEQVKQYITTIQLQNRLVDI